MDKTIIKRVILESQEKSLPWLIERDLNINLNTNKIIAITGPRRSGKTYFLYQVMKNLLNKGVSKEQIIYLNFDDPRLLPIDSKGLELIYESYKELYPEFYKKINYIFFDEIQNVKDWEIGVRRLYDTQKFRIFLTGSSSKFMSKEIATQLRGRAINYEILPFSIREIFKYYNIIIDKKTIYSEDRFKILNLVNQYLEFGGFPEVVIEEDKETKIRILKDYLETMYLKDLIERYRIKNNFLLKELIKYLTTNVSTLLSINSLYRWFKTNYQLSRKTLINYISYLEDSNIFYFLKKFSYSLKEQNLSNKKIYTVDIGLRKAYGFKFSDDMGRILENAVFIELIQRKIRTPLYEIYYYKDYYKNEVDFLTLVDGKITELIQVTISINDLKVKEREINALKKASNELKCDNLKIITLDEEDEIYIDNKKIFVLPFWVWVME
ncbi:MAG: ATP-binding protein [Caldisericia bacterium]|nr:ATP-binding protein [Caldisericia bacterium]